MVRLPDVGEKDSPCGGIRKLERVRVAAICACHERSLNAASKRAAPTRGSGWPSKRAAYLVQWRWREKRRGKPSVNAGISLPVPRRGWARGD